MSTFTHNNWRFPSDVKQPALREKWTNFVRKARPTFTPTVNSRICSEHFEKDMIKMVQDRPRLKVDAIPTKIGQGEFNEVCLSYMNSNYNN